MAGLLLALTMLAVPPLPSKVLTVKVRYPASIVVVAEVPVDSQIFSDEQEVLASINTADNFGDLCLLGMNTILTQHK